MKRQLFLSMAALCVLLGAQARPAAAQSIYYGNGQNQFQPYGTPRLSPYLNLLRGGTSPASPAANAANYFLGTIPEIERRANARQFGSAINGLERQVTGLEESDELFPTLPQTGHGAVFNNLGGYFNNTSGAARVGTNATPVRPAPPPRTR